MLPRGFLIPTSAYCTKKTSDPKDTEVRSVITNKAPYPLGCDAVVFGPEPCDEQDLNYGIATCYLHQFRML